MGNVTYITTPACRHERHDECGSRLYVVNGGVCCLCSCHPIGAADKRPFHPTLRPA